MKTKLDQNIVLHLSILEKPTSIENGRLIFEKNPSLREYIIVDEHRDAPTGFSVKVSKSKKTYLLQRRVGNRVIKAKVGNLTDFNNIEDARKKAREMTQILIITQRNPNNLAREKQANEIKLGEAFSDYHKHLLGRSKPAKKNTILVVNRALEKLSEWKEKPIKELTAKEILFKFDCIANQHRTSAEQTFRWANAVTNYAIKMEEHNAASDQRINYLKYNPFQILSTDKKFRTRSELEKSYVAKGVRKPLSGESLGKWLLEIINRRSNNRTGCDYLLLTTFWGTRKNEALELKWKSEIDGTEANNSSWVDLEKKVIHFYDTKNRSDFELPIADAAYEILRQRYELLPKIRVTHRKWVFPAESKHSKTGHYSDMKVLVKGICIDAKIDRIGLHDLRRTFGQIADELTSYSVAKKLLNHQTLSDVTSSYVKVEQNRLSEAMQKIELHILQKAPSVYNLLLTPKYQSMLTNENSIKTAQTSS